MIHLSNIRDKRLPETDVTYAIMRSVKSVTLEYCTFQKEELAPSDTLFQRYYAMKQAGHWNKDSFENIYVGQFLYELVRNKQAINALNFIYNLSKSGANIELACSCVNEELCHRSIIGGIFLGFGAKIECNPDYMKYSKLYFQALHERDS